MAQQDATYVTREGLRGLEEELEHLRVVRRPEVAGRIQQAKGSGGLEDNAEYEDAKSDLAYVEGRIQALEAMIQRAVIIPDHSRRSERSDVVELGSIVKVKAVTSRQSHTYTIVGSTEADPGEGLISNESPVGRALLGRRAGDTVEVVTPSGIQELKLLTVQ